MTDYSRFLSRAAAGMQASAIRRMGALTAGRAGVISFAPGNPAPETFPWEAFADIAAGLLSGRDGGTLQYGPTRGFKPLLDALVEIQRDRQIRCDLPDLVVTTGSQQGLDLVGRVLVDPGDVVLVELPTYVGAIGAFHNVRASLVGVRQQADGIDLDDLERVTVRLTREGRRIRFLYVVPNFQNPTGLLIARDKRLRLLEWAARHDLMIVEDDPYGEVFFEDVTSSNDTRPIKADDADGRVVYLSTFSKTLAPGFRVAWIVAPAQLASRFELAKQAADLCTGALDQRIVHACCARGVLLRQGPLLRRHYQAKRDAIVAGLRQQLGDQLQWPTPRGGFFLWATLPADIDADAMIEQALERGVVYVPGSAFFVDEGGRSTMRLSFSAPPIPQIAEGVARLAAAIREALSAQPLAGRRAE